MSHLSESRSGILFAIAAVVALLAGLGGLDAAEDHAHPVRNEPALPRFDGPLLGGGRGGSQMLQDRRAILFAFAPAHPDAARVAAIIGSLAPEAREVNIALIGIAVGINSAQALAAAQRFGLDVPVIVDTDLAIARKLGIPNDRSSVIVVDGQGYIRGGFSGLQPEPRFDFVYEGELRRLLHLSKPGLGLEPELGTRPQAPVFQLTSLGDQSLSSSELEGKVAVVVFFSPTCPHCHDALKFLQRMHNELGRDDLVLIPVSISPRVYVIQQMLQDQGLELDVYIDPDDAVAKSFAHQLGVPDTVVIDRQGRVAARINGINPRLKALLRLQIRDALGVENPILLDRNGYSGTEFCTACHSEQHSTWSLTSHAYAFQTLVEHGEDRNPECLPCHTVGWGEPGGYSAEQPADYLRGVQCESCHARGGPHQSPGATDAGYQATCEGCHTPEHSLRFVFAERLPLVSHAANRQFDALSVEERLKLLEQRDKRQRTLFEEADYVGSDACRECHSSEHELWARSPHARSLETLAGAGQERNEDCQKCHTTGFGEATGWPAGGGALAHVGCESCHGPGGKHVTTDAPKSDTILGLTDKCDSCVLLQICGSCHDDANDPQFEFELDDKLERIRHGFRDRERPPA